MVGQGLITRAGSGDRSCWCGGHPGHQCHGIDTGGNPGGIEYARASESVAARQQRAVPQPVAVQAGPSDQKRVALTFDADMTPEMRRRLESGEVRTWYNEHVIDVLRQTGTPATLFLTGL